MSNLIDVVPGGKFTLKYKDIFDMKAFYESLHEWFLEHGWSDLEEGKDRWERIYKEKIGQGGAKEIVIHWKVTRDAEDAPFRYYLDLHFHCVALIKTEVIKDGEKIKVDKGEVEMEISPKLEKLYETSFAENSFLKRITNIFTKRIYNKSVGEKKKELYQEAYVLNNFIKQWFKLKRYLPYEESKSFFPSYAWPSHLKE
tara:strand:- start:254 stop:850 length:597 start_codon:yes stop_codon:yes gene_type:complete